MKSLFRFRAPPSPCGYLPDQVWRLEYEQVAFASPAEYMERMLRGWRRFGRMFFHPRCPACNACRSVRVVVDRFRPDRSQRRCRQANEGVVRIEIGVPSVSPEKLLLYDRYHAYQSEAKGWPIHPPKDAEDYAASFVDNPFPTQEWCYYLGDRLIGVGYVDDLPAPLTPTPLPQGMGERGRGEGGGLSAIYFFYDPDERDRGLGTWNVLSILEYARGRELPHVYLGYYVAGCPSMAYKVRFVPNQLLGPDGRWHDNCS